MERDGVLNFESCDSGFRAREGGEHPKMGLVVVWLLLLVEVAALTRVAAELGRFEARMA